MQLIIREQQYYVPQGKIWITKKPEIKPPKSSRVHTGHGKPGKLWNLRISFPGLESHLMSWKIKVLCDRLFTADNNARKM